jgi:hypothetical protein
VKLARSSQRVSLRAPAAFRRLGLALGATMLSSCLVTSSPDFGSPERTPPFLVPDSADPDPRRVLVVTSDTSRVDFSAVVRSEDDGDAVEARLYIDYGFVNGAGQPFRTSVTDNATTLPPSTFDDDTRRAQVEWYPDSVPISPGCHRFTLIVSHGFDSRSGCPLELADSSQITWTVLYCAPGAECPPPIVDPRTDCPPIEARCPERVTETTSASGTGGAP